MHAYKIKHKNKRLALGGGFKK